MKIAVLHRADLKDVRVLSGTPFYMMQALSQVGFEIVPVCLDDSFITNLIVNGGKVLNRLSLRLTGKRLAPEHTNLLGRRMGRVFTRRLAKTECDVVFAPMASTEIAYLETNKPIVYLSDLTWKNIVDYYPTLTGLHPAADRGAEALTNLAMSKPRIHIYPSEWVAKTAITHYGIPAEKVRILPFGANFAADDVPTRAAALEHSLQEPLQLLWVGVDWVRKGGDIAHAALMELLARGVDARLIVCGCIPPPKAQHDRIEVIPFLNKRDPSDRKRLSALFLSSHFLIFPTQAEATPIVVCEASAHGLPSLVRNTGGVAGVLRDGVNGYLLPAEGTGADYAQKILAAIANEQQYADLVSRSRALYESELNWQSWAMSMKAIFEEVVLVG